MIACIVSNGHSVAAAAALDVAVKLGLDYRGWCRKDDPLPGRYRLERLSGASRQALDEKAVAAAEGTLCFTQAMRTSVRVESVKRIALHLNRPFLCLALGRESGFAASRRVAAWIDENRIRKLHVDGETDDDGDAVGLSVSKVLEAAFFLCMMGIGPTSPLQSVIQKTRSSSAAAPPQGIEAALNHLEHALSLKDKTAIANMTADELVSLHFSLGDYINNHFGLFTANTELLEECRQRSGNDELAPIDAAAVIIRLLWKRLRAAYRIRVVK